MAIADRVVLVTGATGTLGRVAAGAFASAGARLGLVGTDRGRLEELAMDLGLGADGWVAAVGDLRRAGDARQVVGAVTDRFGRVDVVLHLVGGWAGGTQVVDLDPEEVRAMLDQHLWTTLHVAQAAVPGMVERGWGRIIAVSSPFAAEGGSKMGAYGTAKAAEEALLRTLAREVAPSGVTANVLVVRTIDADHEREREPSAKNASWTTPEEITAAMLYLCSDAAAAINGVRIALHGRA